MSELEVLFKRIFLKYNANVAFSITCPCNGQNFEVDFSKIYTSQTSRAPPPDRVQEVNQIQREWPAYVRCSACSEELELGFKFTSVIGHDRLEDGRTCSCGKKMNFVLRSRVEQMENLTIPDEWYTENVVSLHLTKDKSLSCESCKSWRPIKNQLIGYEFSKYEQQNKSHIVQIINQDGQVFNFSKSI